jgi:hypothetical protein
MMRWKTAGVAILALLGIGALPARAGQYKNFRVATYIVIGATDRMKDPQWLASTWDRLSRQVKIDKVYIETYRSRRFCDESALEPIKKFFTDRGVAVAGGMALDGGSINGQFQSPCYTDPADRAMIQRASELTARHFDDIILDDFFFNTTKTPSDVAAKGADSWTNFRLKLMDEVSKNLVLGPARAVNPKVKITIKFPNWYENFAGLGYDLEQEPRLFDGIYTGTETRDSYFTEQHLQPYESYQIIRYFDNIAPGRNGGGWVDHYDFHSVDRYAEQLWDTLLAKAPEMMLFNYESLLEPLREGDRSAWEHAHTSFNYQQMLGRLGADKTPDNAAAAGCALEQIDPVIGQLGRPIGIGSYRPYHATGEDFLHNFLGMVGVPIDLQPQLPDAADSTQPQTLLLTASAADDPAIVPKIRQRLTDGASVIITSGLLQALQGRGEPGNRIEDIAEISVSNHKAIITEFEGPGGRLISKAPLSPGILIPQVHFLTNDAWMLLAGMADGNGFPLLVSDRYGKGMLYVLTIPDNFADLYRLPADVLSAIRRVVMRDFPVRLDAPAGVSLFAYDNHTFVAESYLPTPVDVTAEVMPTATRLRDLISGAMLSPTPATPATPATGGYHRSSEPARLRFVLHLPPHSYDAFAVER